MNRTKALVLGAVLGFCVLAAASFTAFKAATTGEGSMVGWPAYSGGPEDMRYSSLAQINRGNVKQPKVAWSFDTSEKGGFQTSPIIVDGVLFAYTPSQKVIALDAATGHLRWKFDSGITGWQPARGLAYWSSGKDKRILAAVMNVVYALDAGTGKPILAFGKGGYIDLRRNSAPSIDRRASGCGRLRCRLRETRLPRLTK